MHVLQGTSYLLIRIVHNGSKMETDFPAKVVTALRDDHKVLTGTSMDQTNIIC